jgi:exopolyphosphatase/guanosine-5'-triphosphate,3'-diphosphate pyrophosphatase
MSTGQVIAAADLGTNTIKVSIARVEPDGTIADLEEGAEAIRLGAGIERTGQIAPERVDQCIAVLRDYERRGCAHGAQVFIGVATEALRVASNGPDLMRRIREETGWQIATISGDEEAHLTFAGLRDQVPASGRAMIVDIGGGSTEVIRIADGAMVGRVSLPLGSGRLADRFFETDPPGAEAIRRATNAASEAIAASPDIWDAADHLFFSGGNGMFLDELMRQFYADSPFDEATLGRLLDHLARTPAEDAARRLSIAHERARVLPAGGAIALAFLRRSEAHNTSAVPSGIRIGLIRDYVRQYGSADPAAAGERSRME